LADCAGLFVRYYFMKIITTDTSKLERLRSSLAQGMKSPIISNFSKETFIKQMHIKYQTNKTYFEKP
jgi:hypothetical protein